MSRTKHGQKDPGFDYWGRRPIRGLVLPGRASKRVTHSIERRQGQEEVRREVAEMHNTMPPYPVFDDWGDDWDPDIIPGMSVSQWADLNHC